MAGSAFAGLRGVTVRSAYLLRGNRLCASGTSCRFAVPFVLAAILAGWSALAAAQTPFVPYYGKNNIHYDTFNWEIYTTDHFEIYYYPEMKQHLERVAGYAESAYQQISADLKKELPNKIQLILFKTHSEFEQENVDPRRGQEGVGAFAEPTRLRMVHADRRPARPALRPHRPRADAPVRVRHHPAGADPPERPAVGERRPVRVRTRPVDADRSDDRPRRRRRRHRAEDDARRRRTATRATPRFIPYNLGHAVFEFIEAKFGKEGIRQFMFALRKSVIGGGEDAYEEALKMKKDEFDQAFERYLKERFKPFRDKERPADYGRDLSPNKEKTPFAEAFSIAPSPSGDLIAAMTFNREDREIDIILISSKDGSIVRNLTKGFDKDMGFDHIVQLGERFEMPWMAWSPKGDRLAYFVRTEKERTLIIQNVLTRSIEQRIAMKTVDEPESPSFSPDGKTIAFAGAAQRGRRHLPRRPGDAEDHQPHRATTSPTTRRPTRPTASSSSTTRASAATRSCSASTSTRRRRRRSPSARSTKRRRNSSTTTRSSSRPRPPIRTCRSSRTSPRTATSTTSGRSI